MAFTYTQKQIAERLDKLRQPFHPKDVQWRVTNTSEDGKKGMVAASTKSSPQLDGRLNSSPKRQLD
jgi:hypothetical protein